MLQWWQSVILGVVEGVTEFLPISSTAHLLLTSRLLGLPEENEGIKAFEVCIQVGAVLAVVGIFAPRVRQLLRGAFSADPAGRKLLLQLFVAFVPAAFFGLLLNKWIKTNLFNLWTASLGWAVGGLILIAGAPLWRRFNQAGRATIDDLPLKSALIIGLMQCLGMWPGISRSLVTILGGLLVGLNLAAALEFSFLLGGLTLLAAAVYDGVKHHHDMLNIASPGVLVIGGLAAMISAFLTVRWMLSSLQRLGLVPFGVYRLMLTILVVTALSRSWI